jgi:hypothetical protein
MIRWMKAIAGALGRALSAATGRRDGAGGKVADLSRHRRRRRLAAAFAAPAGTEPDRGSGRCSRCRKEARRLTFYVDEAGRPAGFCKDCEVHAKRRGLLPL